MRFEEAFRDELSKQASVKGVARKLALLAAGAGAGAAYVSPAALAARDFFASRRAHAVASSRLIPSGTTAKSGDSELARKMSAQVRQGMTQSERAAGAAKEKVSSDKKEAVRARWEAKADKEHIERKENRRVGDAATYKRYLTYQGHLDDGKPCPVEGVSAARRTALNLEKPESSKRPMVFTFEGIPAGKKKTWQDLHEEKGSTR